MFSFFLVLALAVVVPSAHANIYTTAPVATTSWPAAQQATVKWQDDGNTPTLAQLGPCSIGLYAGNAQQQTLLQVISANTDVSKVNNVVWTPDATVGPDYGAYFIKFTSLALKDPAQPNFFAEAFSAKFALTGMKGTFSPVVQAEISGSSVPASLASTTPAASSTPVSVASNTPSKSVSSVVVASSPTSSASSTPTPKTTSSNGAGRIIVPGVLGATGVASIAFAFFL
ncbi:hypothetical protein BJV78DRAFT_1198777 [Lactifluus subvellereus]|nr:hypothetical protein BJV78DRAFT_1198777 [Lactifluus subvellereus]